VVVHFSILVLTESVLYVALLQQELHAQSDLIMVVITGTDQTVCRCL
jgi:hypothetical protein